jgi:hypothetical protein
LATKKKRPNRARSGSTPQGGANEARRERKEQARAAREAERKRQARRAATRRGMTMGAIAVVGFIAIYLITRAAAPTPLAQAAVDAAAAADCDPIERPAASAPGGDHADEGEVVVYDDRPATSGRHNPVPLPDTPRVYTEPQDESRAVHTLEHGSVIVYYRPSGDGGVSQDVIDRLATTVEGKPASYLMPYPDLPEGDALAFTAWNQRMFCPVGITPDQAATIATGFADSFACTSNAPEPKNGDGC